MEKTSEDIQIACRLGDLDLLKDALKKHPEGMNEIDSKLGWTGLYRSVICGHYETSEHLLQSGADTNVKTKMGDTALHQAADNNQYNLARLLLKYNASPDIQRNDGETPLHLACFKGDSEMAMILLEHKANPNVQNYTFGKTPLHYAVEDSYADVVSLLIQYQACTETKDKHGKTPKDIARTSEIQSLLGPSSLYIPSPEPSDIVEKGSITIVSPILSRSNSDISINSEYKSVEIQVKQLEDIHKKIREKVRASVDIVKYSQCSHNTSSIFEPDAEKTAYEMIVDKNKVISFGGTERNPELYNWLIRLRLEKLYGLLLSAGYDDLSQLISQMSSKMPITELSLEEIGINRQGHRKRLLQGLDKLIYKENYSDPKKNSFNCCAVGIPNANWVINMPGLEQWLENLNLKSLHPIFIDAGYDDLEEMIEIMNNPWEITAENLKEIGIVKPGYRHRILSKLKEDSQGYPTSNSKKQFFIEKNTNMQACEMCNVI